MKNWFQLKNDPRPRKYLVAANLFIFFALSCFVIAYIVSINTQTLEQNFSTQTGGIVGPIEAPRDNTVFQVAVEHLIWDPQWSSLSLELLDAEKKPLLTFGNEFWYASGGSGEDAWTEGIKDFDSKITVKDKGTYYLSVSSENNFPKQSKTIHIRISRQIGSNLPFILIGILTFLMGILFYVLSARAAAQFAPGANQVKDRKIARVFLYTIGSLLGIFFIFCSFLSARGWGYTGYYGYRHPSVWFYPDGVNYNYSGPSTRHDSMGGLSHRGGGPGAGK